MQLERLLGELGYSYTGGSAFAAAQKDQAMLARSAEDLNAAMGRSAGGMSAHDEAVKRTSASGQVAAVALGGMAAAVIGVTAALAASTSAAATYDAAISQISTLSDEAAQHQDELSAKLLTTSANLGQKAGVAAQAAYDAVSSGIDPSKVVKFTETAGKAAIAGASDISTATSAITVGLNSYNLSAAHATEVSDIFFQGVNLGVMNFSELGQSIGQVTGIAASMNVSLADTVAAVAQVTTKGFKAAEATTAVRSSMVALQKPSDAMAAAFKDLGVQTGDELIRKYGGYQGAMEALRGSSERTGVTMVQLFGRVEAANAALALTGPNADGARDKLNKIRDSAGSTEAAYQIMAQTVDQKTKVLAASFEAAKISVGNVFLPVFSELLDLIIPMVQGAGELAQRIGTWSQAFSGLPEPIKLAVTTGGTLLALFLALAGGAAALSLASTIVIAQMGGMAGVTLFASTAMATLSTAASVAGAALSVAFLPLAAIAVTVLAVKAATDSFGASLDKSVQGAAKAGGGLETYAAALNKTRAEATGLAGVGAIIDKLNAPFPGGKSQDVVQASDAYLKLGLGMSDAALKSGTFNDTHARLNKELSDGKITVAEYSKRLDEAANMASIAAGEGRLLTGEQKKVAEAFAASAQTLMASWTPAQREAMTNDDQWRSTVKSFSELVAQESVTQAEATEKVRAYTEARAAGIQVEAEAIRQTAESVGALQSYTDAFAAVTHAGSQWTDDAEEFSKRQKKAYDDGSKAVSDALGNIWKAHEDLPGKLAAARAADAASARSHQDKLSSGEKAHQDRMVELNLRAGEAKTASAQRAAAKAIETENKKYATLIATTTSMGGSQTAAVQAEYDKQLAAGKEALAQTVVEYVKTQVMLGQTSEATAKTIFAELKQGFPGVEIINPVQEASLHLMATVHDAATGDVAAMEKIVPAVQGVVGEMEGIAANSDALAASWATDKDNMIVASQNEAAARAQAALDHQAANEVIASSGASTRDLVLYGEEEMIAAYGAGSAAHVDATAKIVDSSNIAAGASETAATRVSTAQATQATAVKTGADATVTSGKLAEGAFEGIGAKAGSAASAVGGHVGSLKSSVAGIGGTAAGAGDAIGSAFAGAGGQVQSAGNVMKTALSDAEAKALAAKLAVEGLQKMSTTLGTDGASSMGDATQAAEKHGTVATRASEETTKAQVDELEGLTKLKRAYDDLPKRVEIEIALDNIDAALFKISEINRGLAAAGSAEANPGAGGGGAPAPPPGAGGKGGGTGKQYVPGLPPGTVSDATSIGGMAGAAFADGFLTGSSDVFSARLVQTASTDGMLFGQAMATAAAEKMEDILPPKVREMITRFFSFRDARPDFEGQWEDLWADFFDVGADAAGSFADILAGIAKLPRVPGFTQEDYQAIADAGIHIEEWVASTVKERAEIDGLVAQLAEARRIAKDMSITADERAAAVKREGALYEQIMDKTDALETSRMDWLNMKLKVWSDAVADLEWHRSRDSKSGVQEGDMERIHHLQDVIKGIQEGVKSQHEALMRYIEAQQNGVDALGKSQEDWAKEYAEYQKVIGDAIKERQAAEKQGEEDLYDLIADKLKAREQQAKDYHDREMRRIAGLEKREKDRHEAVMDGYKEKEAALRKEQKAQNDLIDDMEWAQTLLERKNNPLIDAADAQIAAWQKEIEGIEEEADKVKNIFEDLKTFDIRDQKGMREEDRKKRDERLQLTSPEQAEALKKAIDDGAVLDRKQQRAASLLMQGRAVNAVEARKLLALLGLTDSEDKSGTPGVNPQVKAIQDQIDAKKILRDGWQAEIDAGKDAIENEKWLKTLLDRRVEKALEGIGQQKEAEDDRYKTNLGAIAAIKTAEGDRYDAEMDGIRRAMDLDKTRHEARLRQIQEQYALELQRLGKTDAEIEAILGEQRTRAAKIAEDAEKKFQEYLDTIGREAKLVPGGAEAPTPPVGGGTTQPGPAPAPGPGMPVPPGAGQDLIIRWANSVGAGTDQTQHPRSFATVGGLDEYTPSFPAANGRGLQASFDALSTTISTLATGVAQYARQLAASPSTPQGQAAPKPAVTFTGDIIMGPNPESRRLFDILSGRLP